MLCGKLIKNCSILNLMKQNLSKRWDKDNKMKNFEMLKKQQKTKNSRMNIDLVLKEASVACTYGFWSYSAIQSMLFQRRPCIFQQDNAKPFSVCITTPWLCRRRVPVLKWPSCCTNLSPVENRRT